MEATLCYKHKLLLPQYHDAMRKQVSKQPMSVEEAKGYFEEHQSELQTPRLFTYHQLE